MMAKFVVEFSPPEKIKSVPYDVTDSIVNYHMVLAPFQKQTQVEFTNITLKEIAVRFLTVVNPSDKSGQYVISPQSDGVYFDVYEFTLGSYAQHKLLISWQPLEYGNMRKLIKIEQTNGNRKFDFVILGNCNGPPQKKNKHDLSNYSKLKKAKKKNIKDIKCKIEITNLVENSTKIPELISLESPIRRQTYLIKEKENNPISKNNVLGRDTLLTSPERSIKRPDQQRQDYVFNNHFNIKNLNKSSSPMSDDSLEKHQNKVIVNYSQLNDLCLTPLKSTENLLSPLTANKQFDDFDNQLNFDDTDGYSASISLNLSQLNDTSTRIRNIQDTLNIPEDKKLSKISLNLCNKFMEMSNDGLNNNIKSDNMNTELFLLPQKVEQSSNFNSHKNEKITINTTHHTMIPWSGIKSRNAIKNSPYSKCSLQTSISKVKQCNSSSPTCLKALPKLDKCDEYLKSLANPILLYHNNIEDPFLKMSQYYETEWLNRQEHDMIRWFNALLTPTNKLIEEEQSDDLEQAVMAWVDASKASHKNKPMQFATEKDLFVAQIYRQSPQQWSALRKASMNLITSSSVATVLSKLTISIEKDLITVRDDRQLHLDLSIKKKIIDLLKCYNPLWLRIGMEAIYGQIILIKPGSNDLDGIGWFIRKHLFHNDYVKQKFTKTSVLQVNLPQYNTAMKKFILRKLFMLIYFLDRAKEQQLIRHNPCLFKTESLYKSSYDLLMGFCADMVSAHGDIVRRLRSIGYNLSYKQTHLDEVNYAVKSLNDLRDGTRITKLVEILFKGNPLSQKLRLPAISKLQKIHNVNLAFTRITEHICIEGNINIRDIVNGHREKILSLFWQIIYKYLTPRYNNAATKIQNWWKNNSLKLVILKRIQAKKIAKRHWAATKIQALVRGHLIRTQWPRMQAELIENRKILHTASTKIKCYLRDKLKLLTDERIRFIILKKTVLFVQRKYRAKMSMLKERQKYLKAKHSAVMIQKVFRGFILRKKWPQIKSDLHVKNRRRIAAINIIKHVLRKNLPLTQDRIKFLKLRNSILYIQRLYIANKLMKLQLYHYITLKNTAIFVQRKFRANILMKMEQITYLKVKQSVILIQKTFRGYLVRKNWRDTQNRLLLEKNIRIYAINTIKRALRQNLSENQDRKKFIEIKNSVLYIQQVWRANNLMKIQNNSYKTLLYTTILIQRKFRAKLAMMNERQKYLKAKCSVVIIQKVFRGFILRKKWPQIKSDLHVKNRRRIAAINIIKHVLRKNLPLTQDRIKFLKLRNSVLYIQRLFIANRLMKLQMKYYTTLKKNVVIIQRKFRESILVKNERRNYLKVKQSILLIQKMFRGFIVRKSWPDNKKCLMLEKKKQIVTLEVNKEKNNAAIIIQASIRGYLTRKKLFMVKNKILIQKQVSAAIQIQSLWKGYCVRKRYQCQQKTIRKPSKDVRTLGKRYKDTVTILYKLQRNIYSYKELSTLFWNLDTCTTLSKELCIKTVEENTIDCIFRFLMHSNRSEPSIEARQPAIRVLTNLLRYNETKRLTWIKAVNAGIVKELIEMMKTSCGKFGTSKTLYCLIATWIWIALQDSTKIKYIKTISNAVNDFKFMMNVLNKKYKSSKIDKKVMILPSKRPTWSIGSDCQKSFESDLYATIQICKILNIK